MSDRQKIKYEEYLIALEIVNSYHTQLLQQHNSLIDIALTADDDNMILSFLKSNNFPKRTINAIIEFIGKYGIAPPNISKEEVSVKMFLSGLSKTGAFAKYRFHTVKKQFDIVRNISASEFQKVLIFLYENGYSDFFEKKYPNLNVYYKV